MHKDSLKGYLDDLASKKPTPGGGSAAALVGATGVALISMVANFTIGKEKYKAVEKEIKKILSVSEILRKRLISLIDEDATAYKKVSNAYKLPKDNPGNKRKRSEAIQRALREALAVPLEVCRRCHQAIRLCPAINEKGNTNLISDVEVAGFLLKAGFRSALVNVEINLKGIKDKRFIAKIRKILQPMEKEMSLGCFQRAHPRDDFSGEKSKE